ncbi:MAG TPA: hypothetical protein VG815_06560 [Chloroflexota bacterium]|nr:hypothetical protein [Chloroflexota bacterium]
MTRETIYASLMRLYPKRFRREYEDQMLHTFRELSRDSPHAPVYFWSVILHDVCRSAVREYVDAWTCGLGRLARDWVSACSLGAMASGAVMWVFIMSVNLLFPPRHDPRGFVHIVATNLPTGVYGALIGLVIGSAQALVLRHHVRRGVLWIVGTSFAGGAGFPLGLALANWIGVRLVPIGYFAGVTLLGVLVGMTQSLLLRRNVQSAVRWIRWNAFAVPAGMFAGIACEFLLRANPRTWQGLALVFAAYPAVIGLVLGALTVRPLTVLLSHRDFTPDSSDNQQ